MKGHCARSCLLGIRCQKSSAVLSAIPMLYATSCFHTGPVEWPTTYAELHRVSDGKSVLCLDWIQDGAAWRLDYSFGYPDDGDEK